MYYHLDEQNSTHMMSNEREELENVYCYNAYGELEETEEKIENDLKYVRQQYDKESRLYYLRARYYQPSIGRFLQEDVYRGDGLNLYTYCKNNPVMYYDPSGYNAQLNPHEKTAINQSNERNSFPLSEDKSYLSNFKLGDNDIVLGLSESGYSYFSLTNKKNVLIKHMAPGEDFTVENIHRAYNSSVDKINFMVDGMQESNNLTKYLAGEIPSEKELFVTERELAAILVSESNFNKTTFYYQGKIIPFSEVKNTLNLPVAYN